jgi:hypothetical protein
VLVIDANYRRKLVTAGIVKAAYRGVLDASTFTGTGVSEMPFQREGIELKLPHLAVDALRVAEHTLPALDILTLRILPAQE